MAAISGRRYSSAVMRSMGDANVRAKSFDVEPAYNLTFPLYLITGASGFTSGPK
jgi:hypothetical protein